MKKFFLYTMGCQMNVHDSEKMSGLLLREGYCASAGIEDADLVIFNTCSVRQKAEQKFFSELGTLKKLKKTKPGVKIAVAGCIAQQQGKKVFTRAPHVDYVFGPQNLYRLPSLLNGPSHTTANEDNPHIADADLPAARRAGGRAWVYAMFGCNNYCTYCIVPYTRGTEKSRPSVNILREIEGLAGNGFREVTLLGQNVNSYNSDLSFPELLKKINSINGLQRIRFMTSHPKDLSEELIKVIHEADKVCEHMHLPLQSASNRILLLMNRGYTYEEYLAKIQALRRRIPGISITTDIIAGFPGETDEDHALTIKALKDIKFDAVFAFKYSPRPGTKAAVMEKQVSDELRAARLAEILDVNDAISLKKNEKLLNSIQEILVEGVSEMDNKILAGRTRSGRTVNFTGSASAAGSIISVRITGAGKNSLKGCSL